MSKLEHDRIVLAIRDAESKTSAEIRVFIQRGKLEGDPLLAAQKKFHHLRMHRTTEHNGVLIFVAPRAHKFAVIGDRGIHERCGDALWQRLIEQMRENFRHERFTDALVEAIEQAGSSLAEHFPRRPGSSGQLPDEVVEG